MDEVAGREINVSALLGSTCVGYDRGEREDEMGKAIQIRHCLHSAGLTVTQNAHNSMPSLSGRSRRVKTSNFIK